MSIKVKKPEVKMNLYETDKDVLKSFITNEKIDGVFFVKLDIENPIIRINTAFKGCSSLEKISVLPRIYHN